MNRCTVIYYLHQGGCFCVCLQDCAKKNYSTDFTTFHGKVADGPLKNPSDFDNNLDQVRVRVDTSPSSTVLQLDKGRVVPNNTDCLHGRWKRGGMQVI